MTGSTRPLVYLAQPMAHRTWSTILDNQIALAAALEPHNIEVLSPVSGLDIADTPLGGTPNVTPANQTLLISRHFVARDLAMVRRADALLVDVRGHKSHTPSLGVTYELGFAAALSKPVVILWESKDQWSPANPFWMHGNPHTIHVHDLDNAALTLAALLVPGLHLRGLSCPSWTSYRQSMDDKAAGRRTGLSARAHGRLSVQQAEREQEQGTRGALEVDNP